MRFITLFLLMIFFSALISCAGPKSLENLSDSGFSPGSALIRFYRGPLNHLSAVRHGECPMYPSCSEYSRQAFRKYGFFIGWMMTCDRLLRCGRDELETGPIMWINGKWKCYDPLEN